MKRHQTFTSLGRRHSSVQMFGQTLLLDLTAEILAARLRHTGYQVPLTPFGWVCEWELAVFGESLAKVFKSL